jgi:hypothetical protein
LLGEALGSSLQVGSICLLIVVFTSLHCLKTFVTILGIWVLRDLLLLRLDLLLDHFLDLWHNFHWLDLFFLILLLVLVLSCFLALLSVNLWLFFLNMGNWLVVLFLKVSLFLFFAGFFFFILSSSD